VKQLLLVLLQTMAASLRLEGAKFEPAQAAPPVDPTTLTVVPNETLTEIDPVTAAASRLLASAHAARAQPAQLERAKTVEEALPRLQACYATLLRLLIGFVPRDAQHAHGITAVLGYIADIADGTEDDSAMSIRRMVEDLEPASEAREVAISRLWDFARDQTLPKPADPFGAFAPLTSAMLHFALAVEEMRTILTEIL
jgi:hypothetical protein